MFFILPNRESGVDCVKESKYPSHLYATRTEQGGCVSHYFLRASLSTTRARAPSPVTLQAVPKQSIAM